MDRMKIGMTALLFTLLLFLLAMVFAGIYALSFRNNYKAYNLLRIDPLETGRLRSANQDQPELRADIWMIGDSRIARWDTRLLNTGLQTANLGMEGQTSTQVFYRFKNDLEIDTPAIVILEAGINDLKVIGLDRKLAGPVKENLYTNIKEIRDLCIRNKIPMILINVFPVGKIEMTRRLMWNSTVNEAIRSVNETLKGYCENNGVFYFDAYEILAGPSETVKPEYRDDFLHINGKGYEALSLELTELINKIENNYK
jgi:lysophospholipase L1-like esterase